MAPKLQQSSILTKKVRKSRKFLHKSNFCILNMRRWGNPVSVFYERHTVFLIWTCVFHFDSLSLYSSPPVWLYCQSQDLANVCSGWHRSSCRFCQLSTANARPLNRWGTSWMQSGAVPSKHKKHGWDRGGVEWPFFTWNFVTFGPV